LKAWFISDIHLKSLNERNGIVLLRFLHSLADTRQCTHLFLLGDIFDFWVGDDQFFYRKFQPIVDAILALKKAGIKVVYFEGNHDVHVFDFWQKQHNIPCFVDDQYFNIAGRTVRVSHGDLINEGDLAYQRYRRVYRHKLVEKVFRLIPPAPLDEIGKWASSFSKKNTSRRGRDSKEDMIQMIRAYAEKSYGERAFDFIISGHMHIKDDYAFSGSRSINLGSWFEQPSAFWLSEDASGWEELAT
jgi:UDP-2,3-diacylglucosamine hydrolase